MSQEDQSKIDGAQSKHRYLLFPEVEHPGALEPLVTMIHLSKLDWIKDESIKLHKDLAQKQRTANFLSRFITTLQAAANDKGDVDLEKVPELKDWLNKAEELGVPFEQFGLKFDNKTKKLNFAQRMVIVDAIKDKIKDLNTEVELEMQRVYNLQTEMHEAYQWMRAHSKVLHEIKKKFTERLDSRH